MRVQAVSPETQAAILAWYDARGRTLPFRGQRDPYAILVSEVMAQQTQISRVAEQWATFMTTFPTVASLANAPIADVLRAWRGLGYNRRALNLQRAARVIVSEHGGPVPSSLDELLGLPGVGPYTARAVAALAFGQAVGPVDTNVRRVLGRLVSADGVTSARELQSIADESVPPARPADWTHALMDLGATVCRPAAPRCAECPAARWCRSATRVTRRVRRGEQLPAPPSRRRAGGCADGSSISCATCPMTSGERSPDRSASTGKGPSTRLSWQCSPRASSSGIWPTPVESDWRGERRQAVRSRNVTQQKPG